MRFSCRFPDWQPPTDAQSGALPGLPALSLAQRVELQRQQEAAVAAAAAGQQQPYGGSPPADAGAYYGSVQPASSTAPAAGCYGQSGGGTLLDKFGQREPDYGYYTGAEVWQIRLSAFYCGFAKVHC